MIADIPRVPADRAERYRREGWWRPERLDEAALRTAATDPDRCALVDGDRRVSYGELAGAVDAAVARLRRLGVRRGDAVVVQLPNDAAYVVLVLALLRLGAPPVLTLPSLRRYELERIIGRVRPVALAVPRRHRRFDHLGLAASLAAADDGIRWLLVAGAGEAGAPATGGSAEVVDLDALTAGAGGLDAAGVDTDGGEVAPDPSDPALVLLSSGSTGPPKLMVRTHEDYGYVVRTTSEVAGVTAGTVYLAAMPAVHTFVLAYPGILGTLAAGGRVVLGRADDPAGALALAGREGVTHTAAVPGLVRQWVGLVEDGHPRPGRLAVLQVGGAKLDADTARAARSVLGATVQQVYGMSEGLANYTRLTEPDDVIAGTQGRPVSPGDEIRVVDPDDRPITPGATGELHTRGPSTVPGYYADPEATARAFTADGFYRTGDLVQVHPSGNLVVVGRIKNLINRGGEKICAEQLEEAVLAHPAVAAAAAVAMPHPGYGEAVCLFVVPDAGAGDAGAGDADVGAGDAGAGGAGAGGVPTLGGLRRFLEAGGLARYKLPERLELVGSLPTVGVKVDRGTLRERAAALATAPAGAVATGPAGAVATGPAGAVGAGPGSSSGAPGPVPAPR